MRLSSDSVDYDLVGGELDREMMWVTEIPTFYPKPDINLFRLQTLATYNKEGQLKKRTVGG